MILSPDRAEPLQATHTTALSLTSPFPPPPNHSPLAEWEGETGSKCWGVGRLIYGESLTEQYKEQVNEGINSNSKESNM